MSDYLIKLRTTRPYPSSIPKCGNFLTIYQCFIIGLYEYIIVITILIGV